MYLEKCLFLYFVAYLTCNKMFCYRDSVTAVSSVGEVGSRQAPQPVAALGAPSRVETQTVQPPLVVPPVEQTVQPPLVVPPVEQPGVDDEELRTPLLVSSDDVGIGLAGPEVILASTEQGNYFKDAS